ncbi:MAG: hypothetical protein CFE25_17200 [Chitinophagaceae bacterium BSSC1]|nr:MAG: hypothetical protein CFE25_17200 [Chitinophagaceae bacterium BSSC1]
MIPNSLKIQFEIQNKIKELFESPSVKLYLKNENRIINSMLNYEQMQSLITIQNKLQKNETIFKAFNSIDQIFRSSQLNTEIINLASINFDFNKIKREGENKKQIVIDESRKVKRIISDIYQDFPQIYKIEPREFEELIAELLRNDGYDVELTKQTRDNGYDILALKKIDTKSLPLKFLVECKRYNEKRSVGVEIIRSFKEVIDTQQANRGIIVTTSYFSSGAISKKNQDPYLLDYRDKNSIMQWVEQYYNDILKKCN